MRSSKRGLSHSKCSTQGSEGYVGQVQVDLHREVREVILGADFIFQIQLLIRELVLKFDDLVKRESVFNCNRNLIGDLAEQFNVRL